MLHSVEWHFGTVHVKDLSYAGKQSREQREKIICLQAWDIEYEMILRSPVRPRNNGQAMFIFPRLAGIAIGRTPLIKLSPKKTWEGFCGGLLMTLAAAWFLADWMSHYKWLVCPRTVCLLYTRTVYHKCFYNSGNSTGQQE